MPAAPVGTDLEDLETVQEWIRKLPRLQSLAFRHIYLEGKTQEEAAALIGCSPPTLSRIHRDAIATTPVLPEPGLAPWRRLATEGRARSPRLPHAARSVARDG